MNSLTTPPSPPWIPTGGEMGAKIRAYPWDKTTLGAIANWPTVLKTLVQLMLSAEQPMFMAWGPEQIWFYNDAFIPILGSKHPEALGKHALNEVWAEAAAELRPLFRSVFAGTPIHMQDINIQLDRSGHLEEAHFSFSYTPVRDEERVVALFGTCIETTDRVMVARLQSDAIKRQQRLFEQAPGFIIVMRGPNHMVEFVNDAHRRLFASEGWSGKPIRDAFPDIAGQGFFERLDHVYKTGEIYQARSEPVRFRRAASDTEELRYLTFIYAPVIDDDGTIGGIFCEGFDVTDTRKLEDELQYLNISLEHRIAERTDELSAVQDALRQSQKMEAVGQLTGGIAHDFNNLLQGIIGSLERVQIRLSGGRTGDATRFLQTAIDAADRAATLTHRLLAFSRRQTLDPRPLDVNKLITGVEDLIRRTMGPGVTIDVEGADELWLTKVDASQLENSLINLCINARDAMPDGGYLTIDTANVIMDEHTAIERDLAPGAYISLCVTDTGTGMEREVIERAFDPFFTTKPIGRGTGLGLSMVYGFVRQSGGQVRIDSDLGKGTTICLYFPRYAGSADAPIKQPALETIEARAGEVVMVVDDDATVRMLVTETLAEAGYGTVNAADGAGALDILQSDARIDLLITDVGLPGGMNGRQVADAGRAIRDDLKVLFITGFAESAAIGDGALEIGMEILPKPFTMTTLGVKVRAMLEGQD